MGLPGARPPPFIGGADSQTVWTRNGIAGATALAYTVREAHDYGFTGIQTMILVVLVAGLCAALICFRREPLAWQPPPSLAALFRFCGRHTLEIYGISVLASHVIAYAITL